MTEEGYIKFHCTWVECELGQNESYQSLNLWREKLYDHHLIGAYADGTGFGNISLRLEGNLFMITGSATGSNAQLTEKHFSIVTDFDIENNSLTCKGPVKASSESLTHAVLYELLPFVHSVVHVHNEDLWNKLVDNVPTTSPSAAYGTPQMAFEIKKLIDTTNLKEDKILVMGGHKDGIVSFGNNLGEAVNKILGSLS